MIGRHHARTRRGELVRRGLGAGAEARAGRATVQAGAADASEDHAAHPAEHADGRQHGLDEREAEFRVGEEALVAHELQVVVAAQLGVAAVEEVVRRPARAVEPAEAEGRHAGGGDALVVAEVAVEGLPRQRVAELGRHGVGRPEGVAGQGTELAEHRGLARERHGQRHGEALVEDARAVHGLLVLLRQVVELLVVELVVEPGHAARQLEARVPVERVDGEGGRRRRSMRVATASSRSRK